MSYGLNSLKGGYIGEYIGDYKGDTRSLDYGSYSNVGLMIWGFGGIEGLQNEEVCRVWGLGLQSV